MNYTKGEWEIHPTFPKLVVTREDGCLHTVAVTEEVQGRYEEAIANAHLIAVAVNGCQAVNPDNPMAVAESIKDMYEALKNLVQLVAEDYFPDLYEDALQALTKAEGREI